jgi:hypothetical protein
MTAYVRLIVADSLDKKQFAQWFDCVETTLPSGLIGQAHLRPGVFSKFYSKRTKKGQMAYVVPLVRNLDASEIYKLVQNWNQQFADHDFIIDYSQDSESISKPSLDLATHKIEQALDSWGKQQHQRWMDTHMEQGWRYGVKLSVKDKTHPWLQPWESLPVTARHKNVQAARDLLETLKQFGYTLVQKIEA